MFQNNMRTKIGQSIFENYSITRKPVAEARRIAHLIPAISVGLKY